MLFYMHDNYTAQHINESPDSSVADLYPLSPLIPKLSNLLWPKPLKMLKTSLKVLLLFIYCLNTQNNQM